MDDESVPESDAFVDSEVESDDPGAVGLDEPLSDSGGSGAHADGASPYLSRLPRPGFCAPPKGPNLFFAHVGEK